MKTNRRSKFDNWGDIFYADLSPVVGSEQGGIRPVLIISKMNKAKLPTHIEISTRDYNIVKNSVILLEQIRTIDKKRLKEYVCHIDSAMMKKELDEAICVSLNLPT